MKYLIDKSPQDVYRKQGLHQSLVMGQLLTPLTRYRNAKKRFGVDNGCYKRFNHRAFEKLIAREEENKKMCLFVAVPDIVGSARRTMEIWNRRFELLPFLESWRLALVIQDGMEDLDIPWGELWAVFLGGGDPWKDSKSARDVIKTAKILGKHVHIGRVNTIKRYKLFAEIGADTCDGSGVSMYDHMLDDIAAGLSKEPGPTLFDREEENAPRN